MVTKRLDFPDNSFPGHDDAARWYVETTMKLTAWKVFMKVGINALFKLVSGLVPYSEDQLTNGDYVVLARSASAEKYSPLSYKTAFLFLARNFRANSLSWYDRNVRGLHD